MAQERRQESFAEHAPAERETSQPLVEVLDSALAYLQAEVIAVQAGGVPSDAKPRTAAIVTNMSGAQCPGGAPMRQPGGGNPSDTALSSMPQLATYPGVAHAAAAAAVAVCGCCSSMNGAMLLWCPLWLMWPVYLISAAVCSLS